MKSGDGKMGTKDNLTATLYGINDLRLEQTPIPTITPDQVLLQMEVVGICGSDVHYLVNGRIGSFIVEKPMIMGHEASGTVVEVGSEVTHLKPGDRVAIEPGTGCGKCEYCKTGSYHLCPHMVFCATPPIHGNLRRYYAHSGHMCYKLPDNMSFEEGAIMEPLSVGVHACKKANIQIGDMVLVMGAGPIGLVTLLAAKAMGASKVIICDVLDVKLKVAKELGADYTLKIEKNMTQQDIEDKIISLLGVEPNKTFEAAGNETCTRVAINIAKPGGVCVLIGLGKDEFTLQLTKALVKEVDIRGCFRYNNDYKTAIEMVSTGKINVKPMITHHFKLEETLKAFDTAVKQTGNPVKIMIHPNKNWKPS